MRSISPTPGCLDEDHVRARVGVELCAVDRGVQTVWTARIGAAMTTRSGHCGHQGRTYFAGELLSADELLVGQVSALLWERLVSSCIAATPAARTRVRRTDVQGRTVTGVGISYQWNLTETRLALEPARPSRLVSNPMSGNPKPDPATPAPVHVAGGESPSGPPVTQRTHQTRGSDDNSRRPAERGARSEPACNCRRQSSSQQSAAEPARQK